MDGDCKGGVIFRQQLSRNDFLQITDECIPHRFVGISRLQAENNSDVAVGDTKAGVVLTNNDDLAVVHVVCGWNYESRFNKIFAIIIDGIDAGRTFTLCAQRTESTQFVPDVFKSLLYIIRKVFEVG